jgi:ribosomal protein S27AE
MVMTIKTCKRCLVEQPMSGFYAHSGMADGHLNHCKTCIKSAVAARRNTDPGKQIAYDKARAADENRVRARAEYRKTEAGRSAHLAYQERARKQDPQKFAARSQVAFAVRTGRLLRKPCEKCGQVNVEAHHDDYSKPLVVRWLCKPHHVEHHRSTGVPF